MKRILIATHHYPPGNAVGAVRPMKFAKYLPRFGWEPVILTVKPTYYPTVDNTRLHSEQLAIPIIRSGFVRNPSYHYRKLKKAFSRNSPMGEGTRLPGSATNVQNGFSLRDWINALLAFPDEDTGWLPLGALHGVQAVRQYSVDVVLTSGPPHSTHLIGAWLTKWSRIPWVADLRDPCFYPNKKNRVSVKLDLKFESYIMARAASILTTTSRFAAELASRYPQYKGKISTLPNGYDPDDFANIPNKKADRFTISYLGTLYRNRDPEPVLRAVAALLSAGRIDRSRLSLRFVGKCTNVAGRTMQSLIAKYHLEGNTEVLPWLPREAALEVMMQSHVLLLLAENQALMIPAKVYDYLCSGGDILALTEDGATTDLLRDVANGTALSPDDQHNIEQFIESSYLKYLTGGYDQDPSAQEQLRAYSRAHLAGLLATVLDKLANR